MSLRVPGRAIRNRPRWVDGTSEGREEVKVVAFAAALSILNYSTAAVAVEETRRENTS